MKLLLRGTGLKRRKLLRELLVELSAGRMAPYGRYTTIFKLDDESEIVLKMKFPDYEEYAKVLTEGYEKRYPHVEFNECIR